MQYLLVRTYRDGSQWSTVGTEKKIKKLHSYCSGAAYTDEIYLIHNGAIYQKLAF